jgi:hypothetical protein
MGQLMAVSLAAANEVIWNCEKILEGGGYGLLEGSLWEPAWKD